MNVNTLFTSYEKLANKSLVDHQSAYNFSSNENIQLLALLDLVADLKKVNTTLGDILSTENAFELISVIKEVEQSSAKEQFKLFLGDLAGMVNEASSSIGSDVRIGKTPSHEELIKQLGHHLVFGASILTSSTLYKLGEAITPTTNSSIKINPTMVRFKDTLNALELASQKPHMMTFGLLEAVNTTTTKHNYHTPVAVINDGIEILILKMAVESNSKFKYGWDKIVAIPTGEDSAPISNESLIFLTAMINSTNYLEEDKVKELSLVPYLKGERKTLPSALNVFSKPLKPLKSEDLLFSKTNPRFAWLDKYIDSNDVEKVINLQQSRDGHGNILSQKLMNLDGDISIINYLFETGDERKDNGFLLALSNSTLGSEQELLDQQQKVARFNKAQLASLVIRDLYRKTSGFGKEIQEVIKVLGPNELFKIVQPFISEEANSSTTIRKDCDRFQYRQSVILFGYKGKSYKNFYSLANKNYSALAGLRSFNYEPVFSLSGDNLLNDNERAWNQQKCPLTETAPTQYLVLNLTRGDLLKAIQEAYINTSGDKDGTPCLNIFVEATQYMPEFKNQSFGAAFLNSLFDYPLDREVEDYIGNPFFSDAELVVPLSNKGAKTLGVNL